MAEQGQWQCLGLCRGCSWYKIPPVFQKHPKSKGFQGDVAEQKAWPVSRTINPPAPQNNAEKPQHDVLDRAPTAKCIYKLLKSHLALKLPGNCSGKCRQLKTAYVLSLFYFYQTLLALISLIWMPECLWMWSFCWNYGGLAEKNLTQITLYVHASVACVIILYNLLKGVLPSSWFLKPCLLLLQSIGQV